MRASQLHGMAQGLGGTRLQSLAGYWRLDGEKVALHHLHYEYLSCSFLVTSPSYFRLVFKAYFMFSVF